ncbi:MAG: SDR family oxidoreductase [Bacteroidales bacterium]|nr:SDR family oxidoreductase [Bacteroidales bacterium]
MKVLFIGGTGIISSACSELAVQKGFDLYHYNRGKSFRKIEGVKTIIGDIRDFNLSNKLLGNQEFDVVVQFIAFTPEHIKNDIKLFSGRTKQYIFISSASVYETPPTKLPIKEQTPIKNPFWQYSRDKIACENLLLKAGYEDFFPVTIVRPSHTYDKTLIPFEGGYTVLDRMKKGKKVVIHGDGTSLWTLTHNKDFAKGLVGLFGNEKALVETFHITSDEILSWNRIYEIMSGLLDVQPQYVYVPSKVIAKYHPEMGASLLGDKSHSMVFDNSKIKKIVPEFSATIPFTEGAKEIIAWYNKTENQKVDLYIDEVFDKLVQKFED